MDRKELLEEFINSCNEQKKASLLPKRDAYYDAICELAQALIADIELMKFSNIFLTERTELLKKAVVLFEEGFFDCAFYLLRSATEITLTLTYLAELSPQEREEKLSDWMNIRHFPMRKKMLDSLTKTVTNFAEMKENMPEVFIEMQELSNKTNKYVHKQGFDKFYVYRECFMYDEKSKNNLEKEFENAFEGSIKILAIMRLAIDPFPILLMDEEIASRTFELATTCFSEDFVDKYLSKNFLGKYKKLPMYQAYYDSIINCKKQNEYVYNVIHNQYIDSNYIDEILSQKELMSLSDVISALIIKYSSKVTNIHIRQGLISYSSERKSQNNMGFYSSEVFRNFEEDDKYMNQKYGDAHISRFEFPDMTYLVEHTKQFNENEYNDLKEKVLGYLKGVEYFKEELDYCKTCHLNEKS